MRSAETGCGAGRWHVRPCSHTHARKAGLLARVPDEERVSAACCLRPCDRNLRNVGRPAAPRTQLHAQVTRARASFQFGGTDALRYSCLLSRHVPDAKS